MNAVVAQFDPSVPAFLRNAGFLALNQKAVAGLSQGAPPRLSFKGSRFRFISADGTETPLPANGQPGNNSISLDVIVVDASEHVSKFFYPSKYVEGGDDQGPACFSDNGIGPSVRAASPQSLLCQSCPKNAWGSKISEQGTQVKACSDVKKLAIIPVSNINGPVYMVGVPAASLKGWTKTVTEVSNRGIPIPALVIQLGFDGTAAYPKLTFSPTRYINEAEAEAISDLFGSAECDELVGRTDTPIQSLAASGATATAQGGSGAGGAGGTYAPVNAVPTAPPIHVAAPPPVFTAPAQQEPIPAFLDRTGQQQATQPAPAAPAAEAPRRRGRRSNAEIAAAAAPAGQAPAAAPVFTPAPAPAAAGPADLNALLDKVMAGK